MPKKLHPADIADRKAVEAAVSFNVHVRLGPFDKVNEPAESLAEAVAKADAIKAKHPGRNVLVYAVSASGASIPVPADMQEAARRELVRA